MLTKAKILDFIVQYRRLDGNTSRNLLRKFVADNWDSLVENTNARRSLTVASGTKLRKWIDSVDRCVLLSLIHAALTDYMKSKDSGQFVHDRRDEWFDLCLEALKDETKCHFKRRGSGKSYGFNKVLHDDDADLIRTIDNGLVNFAYNEPLTFKDKTNHTPTNTGERPVSEVLYANTCIAILNQELVDQGLAQLTDAPQFPDPDAVKSIMTQMNAVGMASRSDPDRFIEAVSASVQLMSLGNDWQTIDHLLSDATNPDNFDTVAIKQMFKEDEHIQAEADAQQETRPKPSWSIDPTLKPAIDALLKQNNNLTFDQMVDQFNEQVSKVMDLTNQVNRLSKSASNVPAMPTAGVDDDLTYEVVMQNAGKVFGRKVKALAFDIPTLVWRNANGDEVRHPLCPDVDDNYEFRPDHLIKFLSGHLFGQNLWLHGHTGTGKTTLAEQVAARIGFPVHRLNLDSNIERSDMVGSKELTVENGVPVTTYVEGILPRAMQQPSFLILDEMDAGQADVLFTIQRALEKKGLVLTEDGGRVVQSHALFRFIATANSRGQGDEYGWYQGVRPMNVATLDRFGVFIEVDYLDKTTEQKLLTNKYPTLKKSDAEEMSQFAVEVRQAFKTGELSTTISPRGMDSLVMYFLHMSDLMPDRKTALKKALEVVITDRAPADSTRTVIEMADRVFS